MTIVCTIGYEGADLADFLATLQEAQIKRLVDVRELPQSRRPGFSKNVLANALLEAGIEYQHIKQLGDPKHGREAARRGDMEQFRQIFEAHLDLVASQDALARLSEIVENEPSALLCYERDHKSCHRSLVVQRLSKLKSIEVRNLGVRHGISRSRSADTATGRHA